MDLCSPRAPEAKGKIERRIRDHRVWLDSRFREWDSLEELQAWSDREVLRRAERRLCPATDRPVAEAWEHELPLLGELETLPRPFDVVVSRRVAQDCTVRFEGRTYSVPFALVGQEVEIYGYAGEIDLLSKVRGELASCGITHDTTFVILELAVRYAQKGRADDVKSLARHLAPLFRSQAVHAGALAALAVSR